MSHETRVVIITGAANGIGRATAEAFAAAGYHVVAWDIAEAQGRELLAAITRAGGSAEFERVDVSDRAAVEAGVAGVIPATVGSTC